MWLKHLTALKCLRQAAQTKSILQGAFNGTGAAWNVPKVSLETMLNTKYMYLIYVPENRGSFARPVCEVKQNLDLPQWEDRQWWFLQLWLILLTVCSTCTVFAHLMELYQPVAQISIHTCATIETRVCLVWGAGKMRILPSSTATHSMAQDRHRHQWNTSSCGNGWYMVLFMLTDASTAVSAVCSHTFINASLGDIYVQNAFQLKKNN